MTEADGWVMEASETAYRFPLIPEDYLHALYSQETLCLVAESRYDNEPLGFAIIESRKLSFDISQLVTLPKFRRCGVASYVIDHLRRGSVNKQRVTVDLCEARHPGHLFLRSQGFRVVNTFPRLCKCAPRKPSHDVWHFLMRLPEKKK